MQSLIVLLGKGVVDPKEVLEPTLSRLKLVLVTLLELLLNAHHVFFKLNQLFRTLGFYSDYLETALNLLEELFTVFYHSVVAPSDYTVSVVIHPQFESFSKVPEVKLNESPDRIERKESKVRNHAFEPDKFFLYFFDVGVVLDEISLFQLDVLFVIDL